MITLGNTTMTIKKLGLAAWLMVLFVSAQLVSTVHETAYGDDHLHDGQPCIVASFIKKSDDVDTPDVPEVTTERHHPPFEKAANTIGNASQKLSLEDIRAPPLSA